MATRISVFPLFQVVKETQKAFYRLLPYFNFRLAHKSLFLRSGKAFGRITVNNYRQNHLAAALMSKVWCERVIEWANLSWQLVGRNGTLEGHLLLLSAGRTNGRTDALQVPLQSRINASLSHFI